MTLHNSRSLAEIHGLLSPPLERHEPLLPGVGRSLLSRLRHGLETVLARIAARHAARRALEELQAMDDRELADIGLTRGQVGYPAWRQQAGLLRPGGRYG